MTRNYRVRPQGFLLDLLVDGEVAATLPFPTYLEADDFGIAYIEESVEREAAKARHPARKRLAE